MGLDATARRRAFGVLMLLAALAMLIVGQTVLKNSLQGFGFIVYWLLCFVFTGLAVLVALLDARAVQRRSRREARELVENTLGEIQKARKRPGRSS